MRALGFLVAFGVGIVSIAGMARADSGPYTDAQAEDGHVKFNNNCAQCHGPKLDGALGPNLHDAKFQEIFAGKKVKDLRDFVYENMPQNAPKSLNDGELYPNPGLDHEEEQRAGWHTAADEGERRDGRVPEDDQVASREPPDPVAGIDRWLGSIAVLFEPFAVELTQKNGRSPSVSCLTGLERRRSCHLVFQ